MPNIYYVLALLSQYLSDLGYPYVDDLDEKSCASQGPLRLRLVDWLLGQAVRLEFEDARELILS